ncbi:MAG: hypothetical protein ACRECV_16380 [Xanthobacteraceae bacterium]
MEDKPDALVRAELDHVPVHLKPFFAEAQKEDFDDQIMMTMGYMAYAYGRAFEEFAVGALNAWPKKDYIAQPMCYLARHSMELWLKHAIKEYQEFLGDYSADIDHHNLMKLWNALMELRSAAGAEESDYAKYIGKLLNHLNEIDPDGEQFRYPHTKAGQAFKLAKVELEGLLKAYWHVSRYAEASVEMIPDLAEEEE